MVTNESGKKGVISLIEDLFFDYTLRNVMLGAGALGIVSGVLGCYAVLRKQSLLGDAISHAALPGIALAFLLTGSKSQNVLLIGAVLAGWTATMTMTSLVRTTRIKQDSALGLVLSVYFGFGLVLLTHIQKIPDATQAGLEKFLFGQAATLMAGDVITIGLVGAGALAATVFLWKEFKLLSFDPDFGATLGFPIRALEVVLTSLLVIAIVLGLQTVGAVLMSAMVVAPAAAARQWTNRLGRMVALAAAFGAAAGIGGTTLSSLVPRLPTGPTIVVGISAIALCSLLFAPARGLLWNWAKRRAYRRTVRAEVVLLDLYALAQQHGDSTHAHPAAVLKTMNRNPEAVDKNLGVLQADDWVDKTASGYWRLTEKGSRRAEALIRSRGAVS